MGSAKDPRSTKRIGIFGDEDGELAKALQQLGYRNHLRSQADSDEEAVVAHYEEPQPEPELDTTDPKHYV